jgi:hypothetical protein
MFDDLSSLENETEDAQKSSEEEDKPARSLSRWSHVIAGLILCLLYLPFRSHPWSWPLAIAVSYSAFVFAIALGLSLDDAADFFGDLRVPEYVATLLPQHSLILAPVTFLAYLWLCAIPILPHWMNVEAHYGSVWKVCGIALFWFVGTREGIWLSGKIKRRLAKFEDES